VQEAIDRLMVGRTVIIVAHRLSTVRNADEIVVVINGSICAKGTHGELMTSSETYQELVKKQMQETTLRRRRESEEEIVEEKKVK
jgi:ABC-type multidrug transport system fused ATPase/permease subunit